MQKHHERTAFFDRAVADLDEQLATHKPFGELEEWIDGLRLTDDRKATLWLIAWAEQPRESRTRMILPPLPG